MTGSDNYREVLTLINRRRRAVRSLESVCTFIVSVPESPLPAVLESARELVARTARRYGCIVSTHCGPQPGDIDDVHVALADDEYLAVSGLPAAADERREVRWCLEAIAAATRMARIHTM